MSLDALKKQIKENKFSNITLFYGEEEFLKEYYFNAMKNKILANALEDFNYSFFDGKTISLQQVQDSIEALPVMTDRKLIVIKDSGIVKAPKAAEKAFWEEYLKDIPSYCHMIFYEKEVDKRGKIYKTINKSGLVVEFKYQKTVDLVNWAGRIIHSYQKKIDQEAVYYLLEHCDEGMTSIKNEIDKLISYCHNKENITVQDIDAVCTKSIENKIFNMIDLIMQGDIDQALLLLSDMITLKESEVKVLTLLSRHFSQILKVKLLIEEGLAAGNIAGKVGIPPFAVNKYIKQARGFTIAYLHQILQECLELDHCMKSSNSNEWVMLQTYIIKWTQHKE